MIPDEIADAIAAELTRLGLLVAIPGLALGDAPTAARFLKHLRSLSPGASIRDVFPDLPVHWEPAGPGTWRPKYRPLGPWDHQTLPTGPAIHVIWRGPDTPEWLRALGSALIGAGFPFHGAGRPPGPFPDGHAFVVLRPGCSADELDATLEWLEGRQDLEVAAIPRSGEEIYAE